MGREKAEPVQRILSIRIVRWYLKLAYVVGAWLIGFPVAALLTAIGTPWLLGRVVDTVITLAAFLLGARIFRGRDEPVAPDRPWWKMTARPLLSRVLGIVFALFFVSMLFSLAAPALGISEALDSTEALPPADVALNAFLTSVLAFLYLNSAVRMRKMPPRKREPKFRATVRLR